MSAQVIPHPSSKTRYRARYQKTGNPPDPKLVQFVPKAPLTPEFEWFMELLGKTDRAERRLLCGGLKRVNNLLDLWTIAKPEERVRMQKLIADADDD